MSVLFFLEIRSIFFLCFLFQYGANFNNLVKNELISQEKIKNFNEKRKYHFVCSVQSLNLLVWRKKKIGPE